MFVPESDWRPPSMAELPSWEDAKRIAIDTETFDPHLTELGPSVRRGGHIVGISFCIEDGDPYYLPIRHQGGDNMDEAGVHAYMLDQAKVFRGEIVGANLPYDLDYLAEWGVEFKPSFFRDVQIAAPLINELHDSYSLANIADRAGLPGKNEEALREAANIFNVDPKGGLHKLPARYVGAYAEEDARLPLLLLRRLEREIEDNDLRRVWDMESRVLPLLVKLRRRGVRVDMDAVAQIEEWSIKEAVKALAVVKHETGIQIHPSEIMQPKVIVRALKAANIPYGFTPTGKPQITKESLGGAGPVGEAILHARKVEKLRTTFAASIRKHEVNGRIHCTFRQIAAEAEEGSLKGVRYGRMSCTDPNLQQQPGTAFWRRIFLPEEGQEWASLDYSQQEPRWTAHIASLLNLEGAGEAVRRYNEDPRMDNHQMMATLTGLPRKAAKAVFLGLCYGEGSAKFARTMGLGTEWTMVRWANGEKHEYFFTHYEEAMNAAAGLAGANVWEVGNKEARDILDQFDAKVPYVRGLANFCKKKAKDRGWVKTQGGRKLHFARGPKGYDKVYKALNRVIQGSAADQMKLAMIALDRDLPELYTQLQIHDEVCASVPNREVAEKGAKIMAEVMEASLPFRVDVAVGANWGECL